MLSRFAAAILLITPAAFAQTSPPAPSAPVTAAPAAATIPVAIETSLGTIVVAVETERAPITAANFLRYADQKRFDGTSFYRADPIQADFGLIQGGTRNDPKRILKPIAHEPTSATGLSNTDGAIAMARGAPGTATGDFFIIVGDMSALDAKAGGDPGFAAFGHVISGMDVVHKILAAPTSPTEGEGVMKGQMLAPKIAILRVHRAG